MSGPADRFYGQIGALFSIDGRVVGVDLFDRESTLDALAELVRGVAVDALASASSRDFPLQLDSTSSCGFHLQVEGDASAAQQFLAVTAAAPQHLSPGVGIDEDVRLTSHAIAGAALVADGAVVHLSAFAIG